MPDVSRLLAADGNTIFLEGLKQVINGISKMTVADEAADRQQLLAKLRENNYDLLVLDISLPGSGGLDIMREIKGVRPALPVLVLGMHPEEQYATRAIRSGAAGYLAKGSSSRELIRALRQTATGKRYFSDLAAESLAGRLSLIGWQSPRHERLSEREYQLMLMIAGGATPKAISEELMLGIKTVHSYRDRILLKMEMTCDEELARYAVEHRLGSQPDY
jgi:two-component system, NarL family, invasion response regulator UvrY